MAVPARSVLRIIICALAVAASTRAPAQAPASDYTAAYPSVQTVESQIKGTDPTDTLARQVAVFRRLQNDISNTKYARTIRGPFTPGEQKTMQAYSAAEAQLTQEYTRSHTPDEVAAFTSSAEGTSSTTTSTTSTTASSASRVSTQPATRTTKRMRTPPESNSSMQPLPPARQHRRGPNKRRARRSSTATSKATLTSAVVSNSAAERPATVPTAALRIWPNPLRSPSAERRGRTSRLAA